MEEKQNTTQQAMAIMTNTQLTKHEDGDGAEGFSLGGAIAATMEYRWLITLITALSLTLGVVAAFVIKPIYRASGLIQVEENGPGGASAAAMADLGPLLGLRGDTTVAAEQEILSSRLVLEKVIAKQKLDILVEPVYFPILGQAIARRYKGEGLNDPLIGMSTYAWGGEEIAVESFAVPYSARDKKHTLIVESDGAYTLRGVDGEPVLRGVVGVRAERGAYSIFVQKLNARAGESFSITRLSIDEVLDKFTKAYSIKERGKKSGILEVSLKGENPNLVGLVLEDVLNTYVRQNVERRSAEAENTLKFLQTQLPEVKRQLDVAESAYNSYRQSRGSLDLSIETQTVLNSIVDIDNQIVALKQERDELRQYFTNEHPRIQAVKAKLEKLTARRSEFDSAISKLPDTQQTVLRLARDVEVNTTLYTTLTNTAQQLKVNKAGTVGNVRIIDAPLVASKPVSLLPVAVIAISGICGLMASFAIVWLLRLTKVVVESPDEIEAKLGLPVYATIPRSDDELKFAKSGRNPDVGEQVLTVRSPGDDAVESLRSLRTTIHFALLDSSQNSLMITGPSPGLGKSFISKNLAVVLSQAGKKVVLVDADLRRGHINKSFGLNRNIGVSEYVASAATLDEIIKPTAIENLWVITTGQIPPNPSEILMHERFNHLLAAISDQFDAVIVDSPPVLAAADAAVVGRSVGATLMVARAGRHPIRELEQAVRVLEHAGVSVKGFVFNDYDTQKHRYSYGYKGYVYKYTYK